MFHLAQSPNSLKIKLSVHKDNKQFKSKYNVINFLIIQIAQVVNMYSSSYLFCSSKYCPCISGMNSSDLILYFTKKKTLTLIMKSK